MYCPLVKTREGRNTGAIASSDVALSSDMDALFILGGGASSVFDILGFAGLTCSLKLGRISNSCDRRDSRQTTSSGNRSGIKTIR